MHKHVRHGDVLLVRVDESEIPKKARLINHGGRFVLAEGETTGHKHVITETERNALTVLQDPTANIIFMKLDVDMPLSHEEHKTVVVPAGTWKMVFEREHDYFQEETRRVVD